MAYNNDKISQGLSFQYAEKQKEKKSNYKAVNNKTVNADYNGNEAYKKMQEGLKKSEKKSDVKEIVFKEEQIFNRKYIQDMYDTNNAQAQSLFLETLQKRKQELNAYIVTGSKAHSEKITAELKRINEIMDYFKPVIKKLVAGGVMQENSKSSNLFKID